MVPTLVERVKDVPVPPVTISGDAGDGPEDEMVSGPIVPVTDWLRVQLRPEPETSHVPAGTLVPVIVSPTIGVDAPEPVAVRDVPVRVAPVKSVPVVATNSLVWSVVLASVVSAVPEAEPENVT